MYKIKGEVTIYTRQDGGIKRQGKHFFILYQKCEGPLFLMAIIVITPLWLVKGSSKVDLVYLHSNQLHQTGWEMWDR